MNSIHVRIAELTAPLMFVLAVLFLVCQAILIVMWVDVPSLRENTVAAIQANESAQSGDIDQQVRDVLGPSTRAEIALERTTLTAMAIIWPIVLIESIYHWISRPKRWVYRWFHFYTFLFCVCPSLRMCARSPEMNDQIWLPGLSWRRANPRLRRRLAQHFSFPMIGIAMLILPVLIVEFLLKDQVARYQWLRVSLHVGTGVIWFAFAAEFILMVSIAEKKLDYIRRNWVDLAIIALPVFSFLRSIQAVRTTRLAKLAKLPQLTKLVRAYRLRGTVLKFFRALVLLDVSARFLKVSPEKRLEDLRVRLEVSRRESRLIRLMIARLQREIDEAEILSSGGSNSGSHDVIPEQTSTKTDSNASQQNSGK